MKKILTPRKEVMAIKFRPELCWNVSLRIPGKEGCEAIRNDAVYCSMTSHEKTQRVAQQAYLSTWMFSSWVARRNNPLRKEEGERIYLPRFLPMDVFQWSKFSPQGEMPRTSGLCHLVFSVTSWDARFQTLICGVLSKPRNDDQNQKCQDRGWSVKAESTHSVWVTGGP